MPELVWYRSLYWRIASGFVALLATLLAVQGGVFLWMTGSELLVTRSSAEFATSLANDLSGALAEHPEVDLQAYVSGHYSRSFRSFVVALQDGRLMVSERIAPTPGLDRAARGRLMGDRFGGRRGPPPPPDGLRQAPLPSAPRERGQGGEPRLQEPDADSRRGAFPFGAFGRGFRGRGGGPGGPGAIEFSNIVFDGSVAGVVAVPREAPSLTVALRDLGPTLGVVALALLVAGTAVGAFVIFGPTRRRLSLLQEAVRSIGSGDASARAPETGGDEVTSLSRSFNEMAGQLEERTRALQAADRTRRQLLADVSHELMTPLSAIRGYVETLGMADLRIDDETRARYLGVVSDEASRLEHIIGDLLDLARFEGGGGTLRMEEVAVSALLERVRSRHAPVVVDKQIDLVTEQAAEVGTIVGDQNRLEQALQNLVANAVRHTPPGGTVAVRAARVGGEVVLTVEDTGPGIPTEHLMRVFDRFYKVDESRTSTAMPSGSGLGLSIVQAIVLRHGGSVGASNRPGGGAHFEIRLPVRPTAEPVESPA
jgi:two-component system OmpR family sensor kinase